MEHLETDSLCSVPLSFDVSTYIHVIRPNVRDNILCLVCGVMASRLIRSNHRGVGR
jgi:hypothetical protein